MTVLEALDTALNALEGVTVQGRGNMERMISAMGLISDSIAVIRAHDQQAEAGQKEENNKDDASDPEDPE